MGRQTVHFAMGLSILCGILTLIAMCLPFHYLSLWTGGFVHVGSLSIGVANGEIGITSSDMCRAIRAANGDVDFCEEIHGRFSLMELSHRFCAPNIDRMFKNACFGMGNAYMIGMALIIFAVINMALQGIACWMLYHYMYNSPKKQYREVSVILVIVGAAMVGLCLSVYAPLVSLQLQSIELAIPASSWFVSVSRGMGVQWGYVIMWLVVILQTVQIILFKHGKISEERRLAELKMQEQFESELAVGGGYDNDPYAGGAGADPYGGGGYGGAPPHSTDPYASQGYPPQSGGYGGYPGGPQPGYGQNNYPPPMPPMPQTAGGQYGGGPQQGYGY